MRGFRQKRISIVKEAAFQNGINFKRLFSSKFSFLPIFYLQIFAHGCCKMATL